MTKKLYIETVGCQMNVLDSELVVGTLRRQGYELTHDAADADVILFNTCSRPPARRGQDLLRPRPAARPQGQRIPTRCIGVLGCMAQKDQELILRRRPARRHRLRHRAARAAAAS